MIKSFINAAIKTAFAVCCSLVLFSSCTEETDGVVTEMKLDEGSLILAPGQTHQFEVTGLGEGATVTWASSDAAVATVTPDGLLTAVALGDAVISATADGQTAKCKVGVMENLVEVSSVQLDKTTMTLLLREAAALNATITPANATVQELVWTSSNPEVAEVTVDGKLIAKDMGQTTITVTTVQGKKTASCTVTVDAIQFDITFETNGGTAVPVQKVVEGKLVVVPEVTKDMTGGFEAGLYEGVQNPDNPSYNFMGWYTDEACTEAFDFTTPIFMDMTLYAKWEDVVKVDLTATEGDTDAHKAQNYLNALGAAEAVSYTLILEEDVTKRLYFKIPNIDLYIVGKGKEIGLLSEIDDEVIQVAGGHVLLGKNIYITGTGHKSHRPVLLDGSGGCLTLLAGSKIKDCELTSENVGNGAWPATGRAIVYVNHDKSVITIAGGEIVNNTIHGVSGDYMLAPVALNKGKCVMTAGRVAGNKVTSDANGIAICGGLYSADAGTIEKTGGVVENNTAKFTDAAGTDITKVGHFGQNVLFRAVSQYWAGTDPWKGAYKIDDTVTETDILNTKDLSTCALWTKLTYKD